MATVRTIDHANILNFFRADETAGTSFKTEGRAIVPDAGLTFPANGIGTNIAQNTALTSGTLQAPASGSDFAFMILINMNDALANNFVLGNGSTNHRIGLASDGNISLAGVTGLLDLVGKAPVKQTATRLLVTYESGGDVRSGKSALGTAVALDGDIDDATTCGDLTTFDAFMSFNTFGTDQILYGMQMVEFPNGLPDLTELQTKVNETFDQWEAGNKTYYPLFEDEA